MSRRTNPWPACVDLFSALLVAAFAGFILIASELKGAGSRMAVLAGQVKECKEAQGQLTRLRAEADKIVEDLEKMLAEDQSLRSRVAKCGDDACLDLFIHYPRNEARIPSDQQHQVLALHATCRTLRTALDRLPADQRHDIEVLVEGHADRTQARGAIDPQVAYLFNWSLSSQRAASVLYEFQRCGLVPPAYSISVIGYADSEKICQAASEECDQQNRRTTLRLRANTQKIAQRLTPSVM